MSVGLKQLRQRGDTIVEVLIAIIVLSSVLAGAYGVASRATKENLQTQEHSQALQVAQAQLEILKSSANPPSGSSPFCFDANHQPITTGFGTVPDNASDDPLNQYPSGCLLPTNPFNNCSNGDPCYHIALQKNLSDGSYKVTTRWYGINGGIDQVRLDYRLQ